MKAAAPYLAVAAALALGEALGFATGGLARLWPWVLFLCVLTIALGAGYCARGWGLAATFLLGLSVAMSHEAVRLSTLEDASVAGGPFVAEVEVGEVLSPNAFRASAGGVDLTVRLSGEILSRSGAEVRAGDVWRVAGWLEHVSASDRKSRALWVTGRAADARRVRARGRLAEWAAAARRDLSRRLGLGLGHAPEIANLHRAILLGERRALPKRLKRLFVDAGTLHVFAVSGLHVGAVAATVAWLLVFCAFPVRGIGLLAAPVVWGYVALLGFPPSAVRAAAMATLYFLAPLFRRRRDLLVAWAQVFVVAHLLNPGWIVHAGSLLSFAVMFAIATWIRLFRRGASFAAWAAGVPIAARVFGTFTPGGLVANLVLIPAAVVVVTSGALGVAVSFASETAAAYLNNAAALFTRTMVAVSGAVASLPGASLAVAPWSLLQCLAWYAVLALAVVLVVLVRTRRRRSI